MDGRLFGLDAQLLFDIIVMMVFIFLLYLIMSKLFFNPVRAFLEKRQERIDKDIEDAKEADAKVAELKAIYEEKLKIVNKEAESLMSVSRRQALKNQEMIVAEAKEKAAAILSDAQREVLEEKQQVKNEVKQEMAEIAGLLASGFVTFDDPFKQAVLVEEAIKEKGGDAWYS